MYRIQVSALALFYVASLGTTLHAETPEDLIKRGKLLFSDDFNRTEEGDALEELGNDWETNTDNANRADLQGDTLVITKGDAANHKLSVRHVNPFDEQLLSMNELASLMIRDPTTVKRQLDRLVEQKFVERSVSSEGTRIVMVGLTRRGEQKLRTVLPLLDDLRKATLKGVSKSELEATQNVLRKMQKNLTKHMSKE